MSYKGISPAAMEAAVGGNLANFIAATTPGGIEAQEAAGQRALCDSARLPKEMRPNREAFESLGFVIGEPADNLFFDVTLPAGWRYEPTEHSMWSRIVDGEGRERVSVFYKAAFYDQRAFCSVVKEADNA